MLPQTSCRDFHSQHAVEHASALDGDTFVESGVHYRLAEVDAPELPGHCRGYRARHGLCAPGDPWAARAELAYLLSQGPTCINLGLDYYHRTLVRCSLPNGADLGQTLIALGYAVEYK